MVSIHTCTYTLVQGQNCVASSLRKKPHPRRRKSLQFTSQTNNDKTLVLVSQSDRFWLSPTTVSYVLLKNTFDTRNLKGLLGFKLIIRLPYLFQPWYTLEGKETKPGWSSNFLTLVKKLATRVSFVWNTSCESLLCSVFQFIIFCIYKIAKSKTTFSLMSSTHLFRQRYCRVQKLHWQIVPGCCSP